MEGWISVHRKLIQWEWYKIPEMTHLFIHLLLRANYIDGTWRGIPVKRSQLIIGLNSLQNDTGISIQTLRTCLKRLEKTKEITIQSTNKYSIVTVCNYENYQEVQQTTNKQPNKQSTKKQQTINKQLTTDNNINNENKDINKELILPFSSENFLLVWNELINEPYWNKKTKTALKKSLKKLSKYSESIAIEMINNTIIGGWKGLFEIKDENKTKIQQNISGNIIKTNSNYTQL